jgi:hypothetical protein
MARADSRVTGRPSAALYVEKSCGGEYVLPSMITVVRGAAVAGVADADTVVSGAEAAAQVAGTSMPAANMPVTVMTIRAWRELTKVLRRLSALVIVICVGRRVCVAERERIVLFDRSCR